MKHQNYYYNYNFATKQEGLSSLDFEECLKQCTLVAGNIMALDQFNAIVPVDESQCVDIPTATATVNGKGTFRVPTYPIELLGEFTVIEREFDHRPWFKCWVGKGGYTIGERNVNKGCFSIVETHKGFVLYLGQRYRQY